MTKVRVWEGTQSSAEGLLARVATFSLSLSFIILEH